MNIKDIHNTEKPVSLQSFFKGEEGTTSAMQILKDQQVKEHITKVPALLICITGKTTFENDEKKKETLLPGDYIFIAPMVKHWLHAHETSQLLLIK
ncbi:MAG: hypothetical protein WAU36_03560 [Cyclobacteriaceae bacterium]